MRKPIRTIKEARLAISNVQTGTKIYALIVVSILALLVGGMIGLAFHSSNEAPPPKPTPTIEPDTNTDGVSCYYNGILDRVVCNDEYRKGS